MILYWLVPYQVLYVKLKLKIFCKKTWILSNYELKKVRIRDSKYGLSEESHIHLNLDEINQNSFYEIMIAISIGLGIVVLLLLGKCCIQICFTLKVFKNWYFNHHGSAGIIFCHFNKKNTKNLKNDDLPIPPGGKGLNDKTRPLNDLGPWFHNLRTIDYIL